MMDIDIYSFDKVNNELILELSDFDYLLKIDLEHMVCICTGKQIPEGKKIGEYFYKLFPHPPKIENIKIKPVIKGR